MLAQFIALVIMMIETIYFSGLALLLFFYVVAKLLLAQLVKVWLRMPERHHN